MCASSPRYAARDLLCRGTGTDELLEAVGALAELSASGAHKVPPHAPTGFVPARWAGYLDAAAA